MLYLDYQDDKYLLGMVSGCSNSSHLHILKKRNRPNMQTHLHTYDKR